MMVGVLKPLWAYRGFILGSVKREFQSKYSNSLLGAAWNVIQPLAMIVVYTVIFSQVMKAKLPGVDTTFAYSEVPVAMNPRQYGASRIFYSWWSVARYMAETTLLCLARWNTKPRKI